MSRVTQARKARTPSREQLAHRCGTLRLRVWRRAHRAMAEMKQIEQELRDRLAARMPEPGPDGSICLLAGRPIGVWDGKTLKTSASGFVTLLRDAPGYGDEWVEADGAEWRPFLEFVTPTQEAPHDQA